MMGTQAYRQGTMSLAISFSRSGAGNFQLFLKVQVTLKREGFKLTQGINTSRTAHLQTLSKGDPRAAAGSDRKGGTGALGVGWGHSGGPVHLSL